MILESRAWYWQWAEQSLEITEHVYSRTYILSESCSANTRMTKQSV